MCSVEGNLQESLAVQTVVVLGICNFTFVVECLVCVMTVQSRYGSSLTYTWNAFTSCSSKETSINYVSYKEVGRRGFYRLLGFRFLEMFMLHQQGRVSANTSAGKSAIVLGCTQGVIKIKTNCMCSHVILIAFFELKIENAGGDGFNKFLMDIPYFGGSTARLWPLIH